MSLRGIIELPDRQLEVHLDAPCLITEAADSAGIVLNTSCGGRGICGGCAVDLLEGRFQQDNEIIEIAPGDKPRKVLGCRVRIVSPVWRIRVPRRSLVQAGERVLAEFYLSRLHALDPTVRKVAVQLSRPSLEDPAGDLERVVRHLREDHGYDRIRPTLPALRSLPDATIKGDFKVTVTLAANDDAWEIITVEPGDTTAGLFGAAVDIGTTTVACSLVDMVAGRIIDTASCYNQQIQRCEDIASRIVYASQPEGLRELHKLIVNRTINRLLRLLCRQHNIEPAQIARMTVSGNTVMAHLLLGINPRNMGAVPFQPGTNFPGTFRASELGIEINPAGPVDIVPSISAYVGGDIVSDIYICGIHQTDKPAMVIDIGTNGEIALGFDGQIWACATPAGPAYEGSGITCGMRATIGAIEKIKINRADLSVEYETIGNVKPAGICGSGLIDFLAEARKSGLIDNAGRFNKRLLNRCDRLRYRNHGENRILEFVLVPAEQTDDAAEDIVITEKDIEALLQAKAVVYSGALILLKNAGLTFDDLAKIWLAGGFARHINVANAITIGMLPDLPPEQFQIAGNASLAGAFVGLLDRSAWQEFNRIASIPKVIELNKDPSFEEEYTFAMFLPNLLPERFPTVNNDMADIDCR